MHLAEAALPVLRVAKRGQGLAARVHAPLVEHVLYALQGMRLAEAALPVLRVTKRGQGLATPPVHYVLHPRLGVQTAKPGLLSWQPVGWYGVAVWVLAPLVEDVHHALQGMCLAELGPLPWLGEGRLGLAARVLAPLVLDVLHALQGMRLAELGPLPCVGVGRLELAARLHAPLVVDVLHAVQGVWFAVLGPLSLVAVGSAFDAVGMLALTSGLPWPHLLVATAGSSTRLLSNYSRGSPDAWQCLDRPRLCVRVNEPQAAAPAEVLAPGHPLSATGPTAGPPGCSSPATASSSASLYQREPAVLSNGAPPEEVVRLSEAEGLVFRLPLKLRVLSWRG